MGIDYSRDASAGVDVLHVEEGEDDSEDDDVESIVLAAPEVPSSGSGANYADGTVTIQLPKFCRAAPFSDHKNHMLDVRFGDGRKMQLGR